MGIFSNMLGSGAETDSRTGLTGTNIAVGRANLRGSVHEGGDAIVTVGKQYGDRANPGIRVRASVHGDGNAELSVEEIVDFEEVPDDWLPEDELAAFEGDPISRHIDKRGDVHSPGSLEYHIDRLVIVPDVGDGYRTEGSDRMLRAFQDEGWLAAQELDLCGSVHEKGSLIVTIDHLIVMQ